MYSLFIINNSDFDPFGFSLIHLSCQMGDAEVLMELLKTEPDKSMIGIINTIAPDSFSPLHASVFASSTKCCELLLGKGAYIGTLDPFMRTPLHWACESGDADMVSLFLSWVNDEVLNSRDSDGNTPIHLAATKGISKKKVFLMSERSKWNKTTSMRLFTISSPPTFTFKGEGIERVQSEVISSVDKT